MRKKHSSNFSVAHDKLLLFKKCSYDGFSYMTQGEDLIPMVLQRNGTERHPKVIFGNFEYAENFDSKKLVPEWITLRTPDREFYSLAEIITHLWSRFLIFI